MPDWGNPDNARAWRNAIVYIAFAIAGVFPEPPETLNDEFGEGWDAVGLLDGGQGFTTGRTSTRSTESAWGNIQIADLESGVTTTKTFTALETNPTIDRLEHIEDGVQYQRGPERVKIGFETYDTGRGIKQRRISKNEAEVRINGDTTEGESQSERHPFIATIFPDTDSGLFLIQRGLVTSS
jgi:hypothetical protein